MGSIADLIIEQGRNAAAARAASGKVWGTAVQNIAQIPAQVQQQRQQQQRLADESAAMAQEREVRGQQIDAGKQSAADRITTDKILSDPGAFNADGTPNTQGLLEKARAAGAGHLVPQLSQMAETLTAAHEASLVRQQAIATGNAEIKGRVAEQLDGMKSDAGAFHTAVTSLVAQGVIPKAEGDGYLNVNDPAQVQQITGSWKKGTKADKPNVNVAPGGSVFDPNTNQTVFTAPDPGKAETERHNQEMERISALTAGREVAAQKETARHNLATEATAAKAADPFGLGGVRAPQGGTAPPVPTDAAGVAGTPSATPVGTQGPAGDDFLKTLPPGIASEVKAYAEGRRPFPTGMSYAKLQPLIAMVGQYDPTFDAGNYNARNKARSDFTSPNGTGGKTINSLNTAVGHLDELAKAAEALKNGNVQRWNQFANALQTEFGWTGKTDFDTIAPKVADEVERLWRGSGGSEGSIERTLGSLNSNMAPDQIRSAIGKSAALIESKLSTTEQQRDQVLGAFGKDIQVVFPKSRATLDRLQGKSAAATGPKDGDTKPLTGAGYPPDAQQRFTGGHWVRVK